MPKYKKKETNAKKSIRGPKCAAEDSVPEKVSLRAPKCAAEDSVPEKASLRAPKCAAEDSVPEKASLRAPKCAAEDSVPEKASNGHRMLFCRRGSHTKKASQIWKAFFEVPGGFEPPYTVLQTAD